jgi:hypothetical protein
VTGPSTPRPVIVRLLFAALGIAALFTGAALLLTILELLPLPLALALTAGGSAVLVTLAIRRLPSQDRARAKRRAIAGAVGGAVAVVVYDIVKGVLGELDPSPYNPFETLRVFGELMLGSGAATELKYAVGLGLHATNGILFGLGYAMLLGRDGRLSPIVAIATGVGWGIFLEAFQLLLYPEWLGIQLVYEFTYISLAGHLAYGLVLGLTARAVSQRLQHEGGTR